VGVSWEDIAIKRLFSFSEHYDIPYAIIKTIIEVHAVDLAIHLDDFEVTIMYGNQ